MQDDPELPCVGNRIAAHKAALDHPAAAQQSLSQLQICKRQVDQQHQNIVDCGV